jgi:hypothetical protein
MTKTSSKARASLLKERARQLIDLHEADGADIADVAIKQPSSPGLFLSKYG